MIIIINWKLRHSCLLYRESNPQSSKDQRYITFNYKYVSVLLLTHILSVVIKSRGINGHFILIVLLICT